MKNLMILMIVISLLGCEKAAPDPIPDNTWFVGTWHAVENDIFEPTGIALIDGEHIPDPDFNAVFEFVKVQDRYCYIRRSRIQIGDWKGWGNSRTYKWSYSGGVLSLASWRDGSYQTLHRFEVEFSSRTAMTLMDLETGKIIKLERDD